MKSQGFFVATRDMVLVVNTLSELLLHGKVKLILGSKRSGLGGSVCGIAGFATEPIFGTTCCECVNLSI